MYEEQSASSLEEKATQILGEIDVVLDRAKSERRDLSRSEAKAIDKKTYEIDAISGVLERHPPDHPVRDLCGGLPAARCIGLENQHRDECQGRREYERLKRRVDAPRLVLAPHAGRVRR